MTKEEVVAEVRKRYFEGEREIHLTSKLFKLYEDTVVAIDRLGGPIPAPKPRRELWFKNAIVWTEKD